MRGRVMAMRLAIALGGTPIGAPIVGWVADRFGPRWALGVGAAAGLPRHWSDRSPVAARANRTLQALIYADRRGQDLGLSST